jgi:hypothetical protein
VESSRRGNLGYLFHESKHEIKVLFGTTTLFRESLGVSGAPHPLVSVMSKRTVSVQLVLLLSCWKMHFFESKDFDTGVAALNLPFPGAWLY